LTIWHCKLSAELTKTHSFRLLFFGDFAHWVKTLHLKNSLLIDGIDEELCTPTKTSKNRVLVNILHWNKKNPNNMLHIYHQVTKNTNKP